MSQRTRRDFIKQVGAGAVAAAAVVPGVASAASAASLGAAPAIATRGRVLGANDCLNVGFVGCGGRSPPTSTHRVARRRRKRDGQPLAVNDILTKRKERRASGRAWTRNRSITITGS